MQTKASKCLTLFILDTYWYRYMIYLLTAIGLTAGGSSTVHTHKQYTEQHNETEYTEYYVHNNKNT
jgi:uncharacterized protein YceK